MPIGLVNNSALSTGQANVGYRKSVYSGDNYNPDTKDTSLSPIVKVSQRIGIGVGALFVWK